MCVVVCTLGLYCCDPSEQLIEIVEPQQKATSAVIFLHGAGMPENLSKFGTINLEKSFVRLMDCSGSLN